MIKRAWTYGLATLALCYVACDSGRTAGSSMETENSIALQVQLADGTPAARMDVIVRPDSYLSGASEPKQTSGAEWFCLMSRRALMSSKPAMIP